jgi:hypothetical protein
MLIRSIYALADSPFYSKIGISRDPKARLRRIDRATKRTARKLIALPFVGAEAWEALLLMPWPRWSRRAPSGSGRDAGRSEWRWLPFPFLAPSLCAAMVTAAWVAQVYFGASAAMLLAGFEALPFSYPLHGWLWVFAAYNAVDALRGGGWFSGLLAAIGAGVLAWVNLG